MNSEVNTGLNDILSCISKHWSILNKRRGELIDKKLAKILTKADKHELRMLTELADFYIEYTGPEYIRGRIIE